MSATITRFAPSPSGYLHLGHIYAALVARRMADAAGGEMRLRIEDIDSGRCRAEYHAAIFDDLEFLGIRQDGEVLTQSERMPCYADALARLEARGLIYPCYLTRREVDSLLSAPHGNDRPANTDRLIHPETRAARREAGEKPAWRLRMEAVRDLLAGLDWREHNRGAIPVDLAAEGDAVIARRDIATGYHLAVVVDDAAQGVTLITRAEDLRPATPLHRILQELLGLGETTWHHHGLVLGEDGTRLAKRKGAHSITEMRRAGMTRKAILAAMAAAKRSDSPAE